MKLTTILVIAFCLSAAARTQGQVNFAGKEVSLTKIFSVIEAQTEYKIAYNPSLISKISNVTVDIKNATVEEALNLILKNQPLQFKIINRTIFISEKENQKNISNIIKRIKVKGKLFNKQNSPVEGATITVKGTNQLTVSNEKGEFILNDVEENAILVITSVQYQEQEIELNGKEDLVLQLAVRASALQEVNVTVSTGYQQLNKERATGSFVHINNELINRKPSATILERIDGIAASVLFAKQDINSGTQIIIRGLSGLDKSVRSPLIIVDNFPYEGEISNINPNDVESINILRDAAASSIWGARAGNGVIVIVTKSGKFNQKTSVSFTSNVSISENPKLSPVNFLPSKEYIDIEKFLFDQGFFDSQIPYQWYYSISPVVSILDKKRTGLITDQEATEQLSNLSNQDVRDDYEKYLYREKVTQQYQVNLSGGSEKLKYYLSSGYDKDLASLVGNQSERYTFRSNNTISPIHNLQIQVSLNYSQMKSKSNSLGDYGSMRLGLRDLPPYSKFADGLGNPLPINSKYGPDFTDTVGAGQLLNWQYKPLDELANVNNSSKNEDILANLSIKCNVNKDLSGEIKLQYQNSKGSARNLFNTNSFYTRDLINQFTNLNASNISDRYPVPIGDILDLTEINSESYNIRGQVNFDKTYSSNHQIHAIGGIEAGQNRDYSNSYRVYGYTDRLNVSSNMNFGQMYPTYGDLAIGAFIPNNQSFEERLNRVVSIFANASYSYNNRYTISASARRDASNLFGVQTNHKWKPLWSTGFAWKISNESFYSFNILPYLNFRATYGSSGNVNSTRSALTTLFALPEIYNSPIFLPSATISNYPNPNLRWERVNQFNIAIDFGTKNQIITGSIEYYQKRAADVYGTERLELTTGVSSLTTNSANLSGRGVDLNLSTKNINGPNFQWQTNFLFSYVANKVTKYLSPFNIKGYVNDGGTIQPLVGFHPYSIVSYKWMGLESATGNPKGLLDGKESTDYNAIVQTTPFEDQIVSGSTVPGIFGNILNSLTWKGISISANITYRLKYYFRQSTIDYTSLVESGSVHIDYLRRWQKPGDEEFTSVPSFQYPNPSSNRDWFYKNSEVTVQKADHIRLEDIRVSYSVNRENSRRLPFQQLQVFAYLSNLNVLIWKANKIGIDPNYINGIIAPKSFTIGVNVNL